MIGMHRIDRIKIIKNILYILLIHVKNQPVLNYARKVSVSLILSLDKFLDALESVSPRKIQGIHRKTRTQPCLVSI